MKATSRCWLWGAVMSTSTDELAEGFDESSIDPDRGNLDEVEHALSLGMDLNAYKVSQRLRVQQWQ